MKTCKCWKKIQKVIGWHGNEPVYKTIQICNGTKEQEQCNCNGDELKCTFYPEKRKKLDTLEMMILAKENGKTYKYKNMRYNNNLRFYDVNNKFLFKHINDIFNIYNWELKSDNEMTKQEAEEKFKIKIIDD